MSFAMQFFRLALALTAALLAGVLLLPVIAITLPFLGIAMLTKGVRLLLEPEAATWEQIIQPWPSIGWKPKPNLNEYCTFPGGVFRTLTGDDGWPGRAIFEDSDIVVFGDSYAFGYGVDNKHAFFELTRDPQIKAIGSPGYNMVQELLLMKAFAPRLARKLVVWFIYFGNDLYDNLLPNLYGYRMPFVRRDSRGSWEIVTNHVRAESWPFNLENSFRTHEKFHGVFGNNAMSTRMFEACAYLIREARNTCQAANADFVVFSLPWAIQLTTSEWERKCRQHGRVTEFDRDAPDREIGKICADLGVHLVQGRAWLTASHHIPNEGHWNESGHRLVAHLLRHMHRRWHKTRHSGFRPDRNFTRNLGFDSKVLEGT